MPELAQAADGLHPIQARRMGRRTVPQDRDKRVAYGGDRRSAEEAGLLPQRTWHGATEGAPPPRTTRLFGLRQPRRNGA